MILDIILLENPYLFEYFTLVVFLLVLFCLSLCFKKSDKFRMVFGACLLIAPVVYFYLIVSAHILNIPYMDDYNLLETVYNLKNASGIGSGFAILFEQVNQHRFAFERVIMMIMVLFLGTVNIKLQIMLGNIFMLGILYFFFLLLKQERVSWYYFIPVPYLLFNLVYFENAVWGIAALQNTPLIFFALLTLYLLSKGGRKRLVFAALCAMATTFISGSGMLSWPIGGIILLFQKRRGSCIQWILIAMMTICFYFLFDYGVIPAGNGKPWQYPLFNIITLLGFWGNALYLNFLHPVTPSFYGDIVMCVLLGISILAVCLGWIIRMYYEGSLAWSRWFVLGIFMFLMGTGLMFVISRPSNSFLIHGGNVFSRRYMIFGVVLLTITYTGIIILCKKYKNVGRSAVAISMSCCVALNFVSYYTSITSIRRLREELALDAYYWKNYNTFLSVGKNFGDKPFWNHPTRMKNLVDNLESSGLSNLYESDLFPKSSVIISETAKAQLYMPALEIGVGRRLNTENELLSYIEFKTKENTNPKPFYFILISRKHAILLPALPAVNSLVDFLRKRTYYDTSYTYALYSNKLPRGVFGVWVLSEAFQLTGKWEPRYTRQEITLF